MRVIEIEGMRRDAVDECRIGDVDPFATTCDGGLRSRLQHLHRMQGSQTGFVVSRTHRATQPVHERAMRFVIDFITPATRRMVHDELGQDPRHGGGVVIGFDLGIQCHGVFSNRKVKCIEARPCHRLGMRGPACRYPRKAPPLACNV